MLALAAIRAGFQYMPMKWCQHVASIIASFHWSKKLEGDNDITFSSSIQSTQLEAALWYSPVRTKRKYEPKMSRYPEASDALPIKERKQGETETKERTQQMERDSPRSPASLIACKISRAHPIASASGTTSRMTTAPTLRMASTVDSDAR